jgi:hypothetical protein
MPGLCVRYFVRIVNRIDPLNYPQPPQDATQAQLLQWDAAFQGAIHAQRMARAGLSLQGFYLCRNGDLTDRVVRGVDFWDADDLGLVEKMVVQLEPPKFGKWVTEIIPFHEDNEVE